MTLFTGYMSEAEYDGRTLTLRGKNKAAKVALAGEEWRSDVVLDRTAVASVGVKEPSRLVNGRATINTTDGRSFVLHFRHKQGDDLRALVAALGAPGPSREATRGGSSALESALTEPTHVFRGEPDYPYSHDVVGESHYREALMKLVLAAPEPERAAGKVQAVAVLVLEPDNPYDDTAVAVHIGGSKVGHISGDDCGAVFDLLDECDAPGRVLGALATIGWQVPAEPPGPIGVRLDLADPWDLLERQQEGGRSFRPYRRPDSPGDLDIGEGPSIDGVSATASEPQAPPAIPAGWFDDPTTPGQYRYWDGTTWTEHTSPK